MKKNIALKTHKNTLNEQNLQMTIPFINTFFHPLMQQFLQNALTCLSETKQYIEIILRFNLFGET